MEPFIGQIILFAGDFAPRGWALCDGQLLPINQNTALFSILGTTYGGDGETNFKLPDLRGRAPVHAGNGPGLPPRVLGQSGGNEMTVLSQNNLPSHTHSVTVGTSSLSMNASPATADEEEGGDNALGTTEIYADSEPNQTMRAGTIGGNIDVTLSNTGNNLPFSNEGPFNVASYIIALVGLFPSRN